MNKRPLLIINVTHDESVHAEIESIIAADPRVAAMFERRYMKSREELIKEIPQAEVLYSFMVPEKAVVLAENLKWVHFASAGVEKSLSPALLAKNAKLTCSRGVHAATIAEYALMQMLAFSKNLRKAHRLQDEHRWGFEELLPGRFDLEGKTVAIIGLGSIGRRVAKLAKAFDMKVIGTVNRPRKIAGIDKVYPPSQLRQCLAEAEFVILATPLTDATFHLIGREELGAMKPTAQLINIGRGKLVDEAALIEVLENKRIAGAALDVFEIEPLPADSPLWGMENVSITPHYSGMAEDLWRKTTELFCENAKRFKDGKRLLGIVNREKGY
jgi:phosphoglycerate dehydrogenase-like enzyme